jgi:hypothetical protein
VIFDYIKLIIKNLAKTRLFQETFKDYCKKAFETGARLAKSVKE